MYMVKVVSLSEEAYNTLKKIKKEGLSFSDVIIENLSHKRNKTEKIEDLINWVKNLKKSEKKKKISDNVDEITYGIRR